ncbi:MAG: hypothetical protein ACKOE8_12450 [Opitutaceae bacterium]
MRTNSCTSIERRAFVRRGLVTGLAVVASLSGTTRSSVAAEEVRFSRLPAGKAVVSLREDFARGGAPSGVWLHLHGAIATVEQQFARIGAPGVLVTLTLPGLSKVYADHFAEARVFPELLQAVKDVVRAQAGEAGWEPGELTVSSFSAGFGGVRQLLRQPEAFERIATLVMADSIYCGYAGPVNERRVDPELMAGFQRYARLAVEGKRRMLVTHSAQVPDGYASTTETADFLIAAVGGRRGPESGSGYDGLIATSRFTQGGLEVLGFAGREAKDHLQHLRSLGVFLAREKSAAADVHQRETDARRR